MKRHLSKGQYLSTAAIMYTPYYAYIKNGRKYALLNDSAGYFSESCGTASSIETNLIQNPAAFLKILMYFSETALSL